MLCPDKLSTAQWLAIVEAAHRRGLRTTATIMFGHVDRPEHWARHLLHIRDLQERTGGFTEFVPLPFVHMEAPLYLKGRARKGPTLRETVLMHAVSRLVLHPLIPNIQVSWVKLGRRRRRRLPRRRRQRSRRHPDERKHLARRRHRARPGVRARTDGRADRFARPHAAPAHHALSRRAERTPRGVLSGRRHWRRWCSSARGRVRARPWRADRHAPEPKSKIAVLGGTGKEGSRPGAPLGQRRPPHRDRLASRASARRRPPPRSMPASASSAPRAPTISPRPSTGTSSC